MFYLGFFIGALIASAIVYFIIFRVRRKQGDARLGPPAVWTAWVGVALYGLGSREDYLVGEALAYPAAAAVIWGVLKVTAKPKPSPDVPPPAG